MKRRNSQKAVFDSLEARTLMSAATRVVGYLPDYQYEQTINKLDWDAVTQIDYFSMNPNADGTIPWNPQTGDGQSSSESSWSQLTDLVTRAHNNDVKVSIVIGGAGTYDDNMDNIFQSTTATNTFVTKMTEFVNAFHLDGIDLDWEPEWDAPPSPTDLPLYSAFIQRLNTAFPNIEISAAISSTPVRLMAGNVESFDYVLDPAAIDALDRIGLMTYDLEYDNHAPYAGSIEKLETWRGKVGEAHKDKLLFGVPYYGSAGHSWGDREMLSFETLRNEYIAENGVAPANNVESVTVSFDDLYDGAPMTWYYNSQQTLRAKTEYVKNNDFGGVMIWDLGQDHFTATGYDTASLMPVVKEAAGLNNNSDNWATMDSSGHITVQGTSGDDNFSMTNYRGQLIIWRTTNYGIQFPFGQVNHITIYGNGGDDHVHAYSMSNMVTFINPSGGGQMRMSSGQFVFNADMGPSSGESNVDFTVDADATVTFNASQHLNSLDVKGHLIVSGGANRIIATDTLSIAANAKLDLTDNDLIVRNTPKSTIENYVRTAYNYGGWNGAGGLFSTAAFNNPTGNTMLGVMSGTEYVNNNGSPTFDGEAVNNNDVLVKYTYFGDVDFNGQIDVSDYNLIDFGFSNHLTGWANGDADYSGGRTDVSDYNLIDFAFANHGGVL